MTWLKQNNTQSILRLISAVAYTLRKFNAHWEIPRYNYKVFMLKIKFQTLLVNMWVLQYASFKVKLTTFFKLFLNFNYKAHIFQNDNLVN